MPEPTYDVILAEWERQGRPGDFDQFWAAQTGKPIAEVPPNPTITPNYPISAPPPRPRASTPATPQEIGRNIAQGKDVLAGLARPLSPQEYEFMETYTRYITALAGVDYNNMPPRGSRTPQQTATLYYLSMQAKKMIEQLTTGPIPRTAAGARDIARTYGLSLDQMWQTIGDGTLMGQANARANIMLPNDMREYTDLYTRYRFRQAGLDPAARLEGNAAQRSIANTILNEVRNVMDRMVTGDDIAGLNLPTFNQLNAALNGTLPSGETAIGAVPQPEAPVLSPLQQRQQDEERQRRFNQTSAAWWMNTAFGTFHEKGPEAEKAPERTDVAPEIGKIYQDALAGLTPNQQRYFEGRLGGIAQGFGGDLAKQMADWWDTRTVEEQEAQRTLDIANAQTQLTFQQDIAQRSNQQIREFVRRMKKLGYYPEEGPETDIGQGGSLISDSPWANVYKDLLDEQQRVQTQIGSLGTSLGTLGSASSEDIYGKARTTASPIETYLGDFPFAEQYANLSPQQRGLRTGRLNPRTRFLLY